MIKHLTCPMFCWKRSRNSSHVARVFSYEKSSLPRISPLRVERWLILEVDRRIHSMLQIDESHTEEQQSDGIDGRWENGQGDNIEAIHLERSVSKSEARWSCSGHQRAFLLRLAWWDVPSAWYSLLSRWSLWDPFSFKCMVTRSWRNYSFKLGVSLQTRGWLVARNDRDACLARYYPWIDLTKPEAFGLNGVNVYEQTELNVTVGLW